MIQYGSDGDVSLETLTEQIRDVTRRLRFVASATATPGEHSHEDGLAVVKEAAVMLTQMVYELEGVVRGRCYVPISRRIHEALAAHCDASAGDTKAELTNRENLVETVLNNAADRAAHDDDLDMFAEERAWLDRLDRWQREDCEGESPASKQAAPSARSDHAPKPGHAPEHLTARAEALNVPTSKVYERFARLNSPDCTEAEIEDFRRAFVATLGECASAMLFRRPVPAV